MPAITPFALAAIHAHASSAYPEECCGILLGHLPDYDLARATITDAIPAQNLAPSNRASRFVLDPRAYIHADQTARDTGTTVLGCYHSHPNHPPIPSATDTSLAWPNLLYLILRITESGPQDHRIWHYLNNEPRELPCL